MLSSLERAIIRGKCECVTTMQEGPREGGFRRRVVVSVGPDGDAWKAEKWGKVGSLNALSS